MFRKSVFFAALALLMMPAAGFAQLGIGVRVGTLGVGPEVGFGVNSRIALKGGLGISKYHYDGNFSDKQFTVDTPPSIWNLGVEVAPFSGGFHLGAGVMHRPQFDMTGTYTGATDVGNHTYNGTVKLVGNMKNSSEIGPYGGIGFGRTTKRGFGASLDLGVGKLGEGKIAFTSATCTASNGQPCGNQSQFQSDVQAETAKVNKDIGSYAKWHPIVSLSFHHGFSK